MKKNNILCFIIYKISLDVLFAKGTAIKFAYLGRILDFNITKYCIGWIIYIVMINFINKIPKDSYRFMVKIIFMLSGVSNISIFGLKNYSNKYFIIALIFWILLIGLSIIYCKIKKENNCNSENELIKNISSNHLNNFLLVIGIVITFYSIRKFGLNISSFSNLYSARTVFRSQTLSTFDSYLISWNATVILPWCFLISFSNKKYIRCFFTLIFALLMFQINGMKTWLVLYGIIVAFVFFSKRNNNLDSYINFVLICLSIIMVIGIIVFNSVGEYELMSMIDRVVVLPGEINYYYVDFFTNHELLYLRESIFKTFSTSPYNPISSIQISRQYMTAAYYHNATNGLIGDFYGNFGFIGILLYPFMIVVIYNFLDSATNKYSISIKSVVLFILMWTLVNTSFFTWIMTGGVLLYIIILEFNKRIYIK